MANAGHLRSCLHSVLVALATCAYSEAVEFQNLNFEETSFDYAEWLEMSSSERWDLGQDVNAILPGWSLRLEYWDGGLAERQWTSSLLEPPLEDLRIQLGLTRPEDYDYPSRLRFGSGFEGDHFIYLQNGIDLADGSDPLDPEPQFAGYTPVVYQTGVIPSEAKSVVFLAGPEDFNYDAVNGDDLYFPWFRVLFNGANTNSKRNSVSAAICERSLGRSNVESYQRFVVRTEAQRWQVILRSGSERSYIG